MSLRSISVHKRELNIVTSIVGPILIILVNVATAQSSIIGVGASLIYVILVSYLLSKAFFSNEKEFFTRFMFGIFLLICFFILVGTPIVVFYELNVLGLAVVLLAPLIVLVLLAVRAKLQRRDLGKNVSISKKVNNVPYFSPAYIVPLVLIAYCEFLLLKARSGWVSRTVLSVIPSSFFLIYFLAAFAVVGVILYSKTKTVSKILLIIVFSVLSTTIFSVVVYPGNPGDAVSHLGNARIIFDLGSLRRGFPLGPWYIFWLLKNKGLALLTATVAKMSMIDVYWVHTFMTPMLWGAFIPLTAYKVTEIIGGSERVCVLAAFLTTFYMNFIVWAARSTANSLGFIPFFMSLYFLMSYLKSGRMKMMLIAVVTTLVAGLAHPLLGLISLSFLLLAFALKKYSVMKINHRYRADALMVFAFLSCIVIVLGASVVRTLIYVYYYLGSLPPEEIVAFNFVNLIRTDPWNLIFGPFVVYTFKDFIFSGLVPLLGIVGLVYAIKKKGRYNVMLTSFMFLAFMIIIFDHRIMMYAVINPPFNPGRVLYCRDFIAIPFVASVVVSVTEFLEAGSSKKSKIIGFFGRWRVKLSIKHFFAGLLIVSSLSAFAVSSIHNSYSLIGGGMATELDVVAVKYIDEHTSGRYVVISNPYITGAGWGLVGQSNPWKFYVPGRDPSIEPLVYYMNVYKASVGYFVVSTYGTSNFDETVAKASDNFGLFKILSHENGIVYIYQYKIPPFPTGPEVMAFYWDAPSGYFIQNNLIRIVFNPEDKKIAVKDFGGDLYGSIDLNKISVDGKPVGNLISVKYFDPSSITWVDWSPSIEIPQTSGLTEEFKFSLSFENETLLGVVKKDEPFVQLWWESTKTSSLNLRVGDFERLYIPGLVGGEDSYDVGSRQFGLLYTLSLIDDIMLRPAYKPDVSSSSLTFSQISRYCNLTITRSSLYYDLYVDNNASVGQWAYIEVWLPDTVYTGTYPPISYSPDYGKNWNYVVSSREPIKTLGGVEVNWMLSLPREAKENPKAWTWSGAGTGGSFELPGNFTDSGGGQNRFIFGLYLPAGDSALVRLGASVAFVPPLKVTYIFTDSDNPSYGLRNMNESLIKFYNYGSDAYVGGLTLTNMPTSLVITEDAGKIKSILIMIPPNTVFSLLSAKGDTTQDDDGNGIPDFVEG